MPAKRRIAGRKSYWWLDVDTIEQISVLAAKKGIRPGRLVNEVLSAYASNPPIAQIVNTRDLQERVRYPLHWR